MMLLMMDLPLSQTSNTEDQRKPKEINGRISNRTGKPEEKSKIQDRRK
jgi:hypothetical protein